MQMLSTQKMERKNPAQAQTDPWKKKQENPYLKVVSQTTWLRTPCPSPHMHCRGQTSSSYCSCEAFWAEKMVDEIK